MRKVKLSSLIDGIESGSRPKGGKRESGIPSIGAGELNDDGGFSFEKLGYIPLDYFEELNRGIIEPEDVIVVKDGATTGKTSYVDQDFPFKRAAVNEHVFILRVDRSAILPKYLFYFLYSPIGFDSIMGDFRGATVGGISQKFINKIEIPLPSLTEQKAIVARLDRAQRLIDIDREMLAKYDDLIQSVFLEMFGNVEGEKVSLSELVKLNPRKSEISDIDKSMEASFLGMADVGENGSLNLSEVQSIEESWKGYTYFKEDDVLFAKITPCMENGKGAIARGLRNGLGFGSTEFHVLRPIEGVSRSAWLYHLTHSDKFRKIAKSFMRGSAGQKRVPTHFFDRFKVVRPTIEKQIRFEEIANEVGNDKKKLRGQIKKSEALFSSLVQGAFG